MSQKFLPIPLHWLQKLDLQPRSNYVGFSRPKFTWHRGISQETFKAARLDRALCNSNFQIAWNNIGVNHLPLMGSDHTQILVSFSNDSGTGGQSKFHFLMPWLTHHDFNRVVSEQWDSNRLLKKIQPTSPRHSPLGKGRCLGDWTQQEKTLGSFSWSSKQTGS